MATAQDTLSLWFTSDQEYKYLMQGVATNNPTLLLMAIDADRRRSTDDWEKLISTLEEKRAKRKKEEKFLRDIFEETRKVFLKTEVDVSTLNETLGTGRYNCVSGTALFGQLLDYFGFQFQIIETQSHVFLETRVNGKPIIMESTRPAQDLIVGEKRVKAFRSIFESRNSSDLSGRTTVGAASHSSTAGYMNTIHLKQLAGLQYYNDALLHLKNENLLKAKAQIDKAALLYPSDRILEFQGALEDALKDL
jgi:hypothetical protein